MNSFIKVFLITLLFSFNLFNQAVFSQIPSFEDYLSQWKIENDELVNDLSNSNTGIDSIIIDAVKLIPRHDFIDPAYRKLAYKNISLPGISGEVIPSPSDCIKSIEILAPSVSDKILIIGINCGYAAAILSKMADEIFLIEKTNSSERYKEIFKKLEIKNITISDSYDIDAFNNILVFDKIFIHGAVNGISEKITEKIAIQGNITFILSEKDNFQQIVSLKRSIMGDQIISGGSCYFPKIADGTL